MNMPQMNLGAVDWASILYQVRSLDIMFIVLFLLGVILGLKNGLSKSLERFIEIILVQIATLEYYQAMALWIKARVPVPELFLQMISFFVLAFMATFVIRFAFQILGLVAKL